MNIDNKNQHFKKLYEEFQKCLEFIKKNKINISYLNKFLDKYDVIDSFFCEWILACAFYYKNDRAISTINIFIREKNILTHKKEILECLWKYDCIEEAKNLKNDEIGYFGSFDDLRYYQYYDKYNHFFH
jgi:hypothetical protein